MMGLTVNFPCSLWFFTLISMFTIDITLKGTPLALSIERKEATDAQTVYKEILQAMQAGQPKALELTCDRQPEKKIGILSSEISAVQVSDKSSSASSGRPPGFWQLTP